MIVDSCGVTVHSSYNSYDSLCISRGGFRNFHKLVGTPNALRTRLRYSRPYIINQIFFPTTNVGALVLCPLPPKFSLWKLVLLELVDVFAAMVE